jgi:hypothetical protein
MLNAFSEVFMKIWAEISQYIHGTFAWKCREYFRKNDEITTTKTLLIFMWRVDKTRCFIYEYFYTKQLKRSVKKRADNAIKILDNSP